MLNKWLWYDTIIKQPKQEHYMNLQIDPQDNPQTSSPILTGWEISIQLYPNSQFGCVDNPDIEFVNSNFNPDPDPKWPSATVANTSRQ